MKVAEYNQIEFLFEKLSIAKSNRRLVKQYYDNDLNKEDKQLVKIIELALNLADEKEAALQSKIDNIKIEF